MPAPLPDFFYGPVSLKVTKTNSYARTPVYSEDKADYLYDHVVIDIHAVYNPQATAYAAAADPAVYAPAATPGTLPPDTDLAIHTALMTPRQLLVYSPGGSPASIVVHSPDGNDTVDSLGGPKPISCTVREVAGSKTWLVNYRIETWLKDCPADSAGPRALVSNRWETTHSIDDQYMTTISYSGQAHFRVNILEKANQVADAFRNRCLPPVPRGFRRVKVDIVAVPNRSALSWKCVDREQFLNLGETDPRQGGSGVLKVDATYGVSSIADEKGGVVSSATIEQIDVRVEGSRLSLPWGLTQYAILLANVRLPIFNPGVVVQHAAIRQSLTDRWVELQMAVRVTPPGAAKVSIIDSARLRQDPPFADNAGINPALPNDFGTRGTYNHVAMTQALQAACQPVKLPMEGPVAGTSTNTIVGGGNVPVTVTVADVLPDHPVAVSAAAASTVYTDYQVDLKFTKTYHIIQAPAAGPATARAEYLVMAAPTSTLVADWTVETGGSRPILPAPLPTDPNLVLLESEQTNAAPVLTPDGATKAWRMSGRYRFGLRSPLGPGDALPCGALPWMAATFNENMIDPADYQQGIISSGLSGSVKVGPQT